MERGGFQGYESAEIAAHSTRDAKKILSPAEVYAAHRQLAADFGNQADQVVAAARARSLAVSEPHRPEQRTDAGKEAVTWARDKVFEREAVGDERGIFRDALRRGMGELRYPEIRANFEARRDTGEFQEIAGPKHASGRLFTTRQVLGAERDVIRMMRDGQGQAAQTMPIQQAIAHTETYSHLNSGQRRAVEEILVSRDRVQGLQGFAGVGKSAALSSVREGAERNGYVVEGFAPTSRAARQLRDAGIPSDTLQGFLARGQQAGSDPNSRHLYMVDEASLAGTRQMREFLTKIGPQDRVLLIGDTRQHQGVEAGKPFEQLVEAGMRTAQLDQIMRQKDPGVESGRGTAGAGDVAGGIDMLATAGAGQRNRRPCRTHSGHRQGLCGQSRQDIDRLPGQRFPTRDQRCRSSRVAGPWHGERAGPFSTRSHSAPGTHRRGAPMGLALRTGGRDSLRARQPGYGNRARLVCPRRSGQSRRKSPVSRKTECRTGDLRSEASARRRRLPGDWNGNSPSGIGFSSRRLISSYR